MKYFQKIRSVVLSSDMPLWKYCLLTFCIFFSALAIVNIFIKTLAYLLNIIDKPNDPVFKDAITDLIIIGTIAPFIETVLLSIFLIFLKKIFINTNLTACLAALIIGLIHSKPVWPYFIIFTTMFYFFSIFFLVRLKNSFSNGFIAAFVPHFVNNSMLALAAFFDI